jgi:hypothetical protein
MNEFQSIVEQGRLFVEQHAPSGTLFQAVPVAIGCLLLGVGISVLGAKLSRVGLTMGWAAAGAVGGYHFARELGFPTIPCVAAGTVSIGLIGYQMFRFWIALGTGLVVALLALSVYGHKAVLPHVGEFERAATMQVTDENGEVVFQVPSREEQQAFVERTPRQWAGEFRDYVVRQDPAVDRNVKAIGIVALITGLCVGLLAARTALILSTSVLGTALVVAGIGTLMSHFGGGSAITSLQDHPRLALVAIGGFLVTSLVLQTLLTRNGPQFKPESAPSGK